jgi:hypothetical protein
VLQIFTKNYCYISTLHISEIWLKVDNNSEYFAGFKDSLRLKKHSKEKYLKQIYQRFLKSIFHFFRMLGRSIIYSKLCYLLGHKSHSEWKRSRDMFVMICSFSSKEDSSEYRKKERQTVTMAYKHKEIQTQR